MSQRYVEVVIGRLLTDEDFRQVFSERGAAALDRLVEEGMQLTTVEREALLKIDLTACDRFSKRLDPRLQKVRLRPQSS
jgi:hypothetical protein